STTATAQLLPRRQLLCIVSPAPVHLLPPSVACLSLASLCFVVIGLSLFCPRSAFTSSASFLIPQSRTYSHYFSPKHNPSLHRAAVGFTVAAWFVVVVRQASCFVVFEGPSIPPTSASPGPAPPSSVCRVRRQLPVVRRQLGSVRRQLPVVRRSPSNLWSLPSPKVMPRMLSQHALGGFDGSTMVSTIEVFDPRREAWITGEPMNHPRREAQYGVY
ncbi:hypothetical protein HN51_030773, partial [Arachis hypogaea]